MNNDQELIQTIDLIIQQTKGDCNKQSNRSYQANKTHHCPLCGKDHYCFLSEDKQGQVYRVYCHNTDPSNPPEGWEFIGNATDDRPGFILKSHRKRKHYGKKFPESIELVQHKFSDFPEYKDIEKPLNNLEKGDVVRLKPQPGFEDLPPRYREVIRTRNGKSKGVSTEVMECRTYGSLARYTQPEVTPTNQIEHICTYDPDNPEIREQQIEYIYSDSQKVVRKQWNDRRSAYKGKTKEVRPYNNNKLGKGEDEWPLYRETEAIEAINRGDILFICAGEQAVELFRSIGLTATSPQGGEANAGQVIKRLEPHLTSPENETNGIKPLLAIWPDNDDAGKNFAASIISEANKHKIGAVAIDPLSFYPDMPEKGDIAEYLDFCNKNQVTQSEIYYTLENAIDDAIDEAEEESRYSYQRYQWNPPIAHNGELGYWVKDDGSKKFEPKCNFDFVITGEISSPNSEKGGDLVLQVKRSFEKREYKIIIPASAITTVDKFVDAVKSAMGVAVVSRLNRNEFAALIHTKKQEYYTNRKGQQFKKIDCYGRQADGIWVFENMQLTNDGQATTQQQSEYVFNPALGTEDFIPCPKPAQQIGVKSLEQLVNAGKGFFSDNYYQFLISCGWVAAGLNDASIMQSEGSFPILNAYGEPGSLKTIALESALSLVGTNWSNDGMVSGISRSQLYEHGSKTGSLPFCYDDPDRDPELDELLKRWFNRKPRQVRGNKQTPKSAIALTTNHAVGENQEATKTRVIYLPFKRAKHSNKAAYRNLKEAQKQASGALAEIIKIGFPRDEIFKIEEELLPYLKNTHVRVATSLAIVTYYTQKLVELTGGKENILQWVIDNICALENDKDNNADALQDYCDKILSLSSEALVGKWNLQQYEKDGKRYAAIYSSDVWALVDKHSKPATYNKKSLIPLLLAAGGEINVSVRKFDCNREATLAYERALVNPHYSEGEPVAPLTPKKVVRKAWLIPIEYFQGYFEDGQDDNNSETMNFEDVTSVTRVTQCNPEGLHPEITEKQEVESACNLVTSNLEINKKNEEGSMADSNTLSKKEEKISSLDSATFSEQNQVTRLHEPSNQEQEINSAVTSQGYTEVTRQNQVTSAKSSPETSLPDKNLDDNNRPLKIETDSFPINKVEVRKAGVGDGVDIMVDGQLKEYCDVLEINKEEQKLCVKVGQYLSEEVWVNLDDIQALRKPNKAGAMIVVWQKQ